MLGTHARYVVAVFAAHVALRVDLREERGARRRLAFERRLEVVVLGLDFRVAEQGLFDDLIQGGAFSRGGSCAGSGLRECCGSERESDDESRALEQNVAMMIIRGVELGLDGRHNVCKCQRDD